mgnify:CR=1 FL=1
MVTVEITCHVETNHGPLNPGDMIDCQHVDIDLENKIVCCLGLNGTELDLPINVCRIIPRKEYD